MLAARRSRWSTSTRHRYRSHVDEIRVGGTDGDRRDGTRDRVVALRCRDAVHVAPVEDGAGTLRIQVELITRRASNPSSRGICRRIRGGWPGAVPRRPVAGPRRLQNHAEFSSCLPFPERSTTVMTTTAQTSAKAIDDLCPAVRGASPRRQWRSTGRTIQHPGGHALVLEILINKSFYLRIALLSSVDLGRRGARDLLTVNQSQLHDPLRCEPMGRELSRFRLTTIHSQCGW